jgi:hypothetical protein
MLANSNVMVDFGSESVKCKVFAKIAAPKAHLVDHPCHICLKNLINKN